MEMKPQNRCPWAGQESIYMDYHDHEWGRPVHEDRKLFEMLILEGMQAGLSWLTVLRKREAFRAAFDNFDPEKVARYDEAKIQELLSNEGIIRNRLKIRSAVANARAFLVLAREYGSFDAFIWRYVDDAPLIGHWQNMEQVPATTALSDRISKNLKKRGFKFVGSTIIYSFMQAIGMVGDHLTDCFVYRETVCRYLEADDIENCLPFMELVKDDFIGYNEEQFMQAMSRAAAGKEAFVIATDDGIRGLIAFSYKECEITFLAVHPAHRRQGLGKSLIRAVRKCFRPGDRLRVVTYRSDDPKGRAAVECYHAFGFSDGEPVEVFGYPCQRMQLWL